MDANGFSFVRLRLQHAEQISREIPFESRTLTKPEPIKDWSLTSLKEKLIKIGAKILSHGRYVVFLKNHSDA